MSWGNVFIYLIIILLLIIVFAFIAKMIVICVAEKRNNLYIIVPVIAGVLTCLSISQLQNNSVIFKTESTVLQRLNDVKQKLIYPLYKNDEDNGFVKNNFILVNSSFDPHLIPNKAGLTGDSTFVTITDRKKLSAFLNFVADHLDLFDLIVCDMVFPDSSEYDRNLKESLTKIESRNKLVLAYNKYFVDNNSVIYQGIKPSSFGEVAKVEKDDPFYFTHRLVNNQNIPSLPFQMHLRLSGSSYKEQDYYLWPQMLIEKNPRGQNRYAFNEFITELRFTNEKELYYDSIDIARAHTEIVSVQDTSLIHAKPDNIYDLGYACTEEGQVQITDLVDSKNKKYKNILLIGDFRDAYSDKHQTAYGLLYGTTILLNEFFQIHHNDHSFALWQLVVYVTVLFLCFCGVLTYLFLRAFKKEKIEVKTGRFNRFRLKSWLPTNILEFILDETHYILLFILALIIDLLFHKTINVLGLLYYFLLFSALLNFYIDKTKTNKL